MAATSGSRLANHEGYRPARGGERFSAPMVIALYKQLGLRGFGRRPRLAAAVLGPHEWGLRVLADHLGMSATTLNNWCHRGWVHHRKMPGLKGCLIIWADAGELGCLGRLHAFRPLNAPPPYPAELTRPGPRPGIDAIPTTR